MSWRGRSAASGHAALKGACRYSRVAGHQSSGIILALVTETRHSHHLSGTFIVQEAKIIAGAITAPIRSVGHLQLTISSACVIMRVRSKLTDLLRQSSRRTDDAHHQLNPLAFGHR